MVEVLLPHHLHHQVALDCIAAGKHVSVQKPMSMNLKEADDMIAAAAKAGVYLKVFENFLFMPQIQRAKELVEAGEIGEPITVRMKTIAGTSPDAWKVPVEAYAWRSDRALSGFGPWIGDDGHHMYSLAWYFMGMAEEVHAFAGETRSPSGGVSDVPCVVSWKHADNRYGSWEAVRAPELVMNTDYYAADDRLEITGTKGVIWVMRGHGKMFDGPPVILYRDRQVQTFSDIPSGWEQSFMRSTRQFIEALNHGEPPLLTGEQGRDIIRWILSAEESAVTGKNVKV
jgi:predicted dehydrogenase